MQTSNNKGSIEVIAGPMFAGKSAELLRRIAMLRSVSKSVFVAKPSKDRLFSINEVVSRLGLKQRCHPVNSTAELRQLFERGDYDVLAIDEIQFFEMDIVYYLQELADRGVRVIVSGLDTDHVREPWEVTSFLICIAEKVTRLKTICAYCFDEANYVFRKVKIEGRRFLGNSDLYAPACRNCWNQKFKLQNQESGETQNS